MARPKKPAVLQERSGAWRHDPQRRRVDARGSGSLPTEPPDHLGLTDDEAALWREAAALVSTDMVTGSDRLTFERFVRLMARSRREGAELPPAHETLLMRYLRKLGLDPEGRAVLGSASTDSANPFADIAGTK